MKKLTAGFAYTLVVILSVHIACADDVYRAPAESICLLNLHRTEATSVLVLKEGELRYGSAWPGSSSSSSPSSLHGAAGSLPISPYLNGDIDYDETPLRRFEIIFLISLPVTLALSFAGLAAYKAGAGTWGSFETIDYTYLILSSISLSFSVAIHDNRVVFKKRGT
jgi:hypothetical protein